MYFIVYCTDKPNHLQTRLDNRPAHVEWLKTQPVVAAGPYLAADGETMIGSLLVFDADSQADVMARLPSDPYAVAGLFEQVVVHPWKWVIGAPDDQI